MEGPGMAQSKSELNSIKMLWVDLKCGVHARNPSDITQLEKLCTEEYEKFFLVSVRLVDIYKKFLLEVVSAIAEYYQSKDILNFFPEGNCISVIFLFNK